MCSCASVMSDTSAGRYNDTGHTLKQWARLNLKGMYLFRKGWMIFILHALILMTSETHLTFLPLPQNKLKYNKLYNKRFSICLIILSFSVPSKKSCCSPMFV